MGGTGRGFKLETQVGFLSLFQGSFPGGFYPGLENPLQVFLPFPTHGFAPTGLGTTFPFWETWVSCYLGGGLPGFVSPTFFHFGVNFFSRVLQRLFPRSFRMPFTPLVRVFKLSFSPLVFSPRKSFSLCVFFNAVLHPGFFWRPLNTGGVFP